MGNIPDIQRTVENCIGEIFDNYSVHPSGVITARKNGYKVQILPMREDGGNLTGWAYHFEDPTGGVQVAANTADRAGIMINRIQVWARSIR